MFDMSFKDRLASFHLDPELSMLTYWIVGMNYVVCYWASLVLLLQEVIRPGVLWFLWDFNEDNILRQVILLNYTLRDSKGNNFQRVFFF